MKNRRPGKSRRTCCKTWGATTYIQSMPIHEARNLCNSVRKSWVWQLLCHKEESHMWYCTSGDSACTFSRKQKTAARTAPKQYRKIEESPNLLPEYNTKISICIIRVWHHSLPPLTMKFKRWNTFWVVQPYSGTRISIRISWICKQQFVSYWEKRTLRLLRVILRSLSTNSNSTNARD